MAQDRHIYSEIDHETNLRDVFLQIRTDAEEAKSRPALTELYRRAGYLITLSHVSAWQEKFGDDIGAIRTVAEEEFARTARRINARAKAQALGYRARPSPLRPPPSPEVRSRHQTGVHG